MTIHFIFLHGGGQGSWVWDETIAALRAQGGNRIGQIVALDVPGCGTKRQRPTADLSVADIVADLVADIDSYGLEQAVLVGHSQAGTLLPLLIKARPQLISRAIYISCLAPTGNQTALNWREQMPPSTSNLHTSHPPGARDRYRLLFCNDMSPAQTEAFLDKLGGDQWPAASYRMAEWDYDHLAATPATYVICRQDAALPPDWQAIFAERLQVKKVVEIDGGHQVMNTQPATVAEVILGLA